MLEHFEPELRHSIYDPSRASGGMPILAKDYIDEHSDNGVRADWCCRDANDTASLNAKMNLLLHITSTSALRNDERSPSLGVWKAAS